MAKKLRHRYLIGSWILFCNEQSYFMRNFCNVWCEKCGGQLEIYFLCAQNFSKYYLLTPDTHTHTRTHVRTCGCQGVRSGSFSESLVNVQTKWMMSYLISNILLDIWKYMETCEVKSCSVEENLIVLMMAKWILLKRREVFDGK